MAPVRCCRTCGRDTKRRSGVCADCDNRDNARHREDELDDQDIDDDDIGGYDHDIESAIRDALDLE